MVLLIGKTLWVKQATLQGLEELHHHLKSVSGANKQQSLLLKGYFVIYTFQRFKNTVFSVTYQNRSTLNNQNG